MKKILAIGFMTMALVACGNAGNTKNVRNNKNIRNTRNIKQIDKKDMFYKFEMSKEAGIVSIDTNDAFETGILCINGRTYEVKRAKSADGIKLANKSQGVAIHFKNGYGVVDTKDGEFGLTELKN